MNKTTENQQKSTTVSLEQYKQLQQENDYLKYQLVEMKRLIFGSKTERFIPSSADAIQQSLFERSQQESEIPEKELISYSRVKPKKEKKKAVRIKIPDHLPRVEEVIEPELQEGMRKIGEEVTEILEYTPAQIFVRKIVRPKYVKPDNEGITIAELPSLPIPKGNAGASLLAWLTVSKFVDHLPFYRLIQMLKRSGLYVSDSTINGWFNKTADLLAPLYEVLQKLIIESDYIQADESPIGVQDSAKKGALHRGYHWVFRSPIERLVLFKYHRRRGKEVPENFLQTFNGTLQTDGYVAYTNMKTGGNISLMACMAHARRYFEKASKYDARKSEYVLGLIQQLYEIEHKSRERRIDFATRQRYRRLYATPVLNKLKDWLDAHINRVLPQSPIGKAVNYTYSLWPKLIRYVEDGRYEIDNNLIENAIRPMAIGRKNYLFAGSHDAAQNAAIMYSFFATCKLNNIEPLNWLTDVLNRIQDHKANKLFELLPQNWTPGSSQA